MNKKVALTFILSLTALAVFLFLLLKIAAHYYSFQLPNYALAITIFLYCTTLSSFLFLRYSHFSKTHPATNPMLAATAIKLLLNIIFIAVIMVIDDATAARNTVYFMTTYLTFTLLEILFLYKK